MIPIMHVLCTGGDCVAKGNFPLTMVRWTMEVFYLFIYLFIYATLPQNVMWSHDFIVRYFAHAK